jgi:hypothetical protein
VTFSNKSFILYSLERDIPKTIPFDKYKKWKRVVEKDSSGSTRVKLVSQSKTNKEGFRIVHLQSLHTYVTEITKHCMTCPSLQDNLQDPIELIGEVWYQGLASIIAAKCNGCGKTFEIKSPRMRGDKKFEVNVRAVWGQMVTGGGSSHLSEQCATLGMSGLSDAAFAVIEDEIGSWWKQVYIVTSKLSYKYIMTDWWQIFKSSKGD